MVRLDRDKMEIIMDLMVIIIEAVFSLDSFNHYSDSPGTSRRNRIAQPRSDHVDGR